MGPRLWSRKAPVAANGGEVGIDLGVPREAGLPLDRLEEGIEQKDRKAETYEAKIVDVSPDALVIEASGNSGKLDALEDRLAGYGIQEICRSGRIALERGFKTLAPPHLK